MTPSGWAWPMVWPSMVWPGLGMYIQFLCIFNEKATTLVCPGLPRLPDGLLLSVLQLLIWTLPWYRIPPRCGLVIRFILRNFELLAWCLAWSYCLCFLGFFPVELMITLSHTLFALTGYVSKNTRWAIFMEQKLKFKLVLGRLAVLKKQDRRYSDPKARNG